MRVFVAGGTGVIGRQMVPQLVKSGHDVTVLIRPSHGNVPTSEDVEFVVADALDREGVVRAIVDASPDAIVHMLTSIPEEINPRRLLRHFSLTNRLRTEGTRNLLEGAGRAGVHRFVAQGLAYAYEPSRPGLAAEVAPLWTEPPRQFAPVLDALTYHERRTTEAGGLVLRLGHLYGPGTIYDPDGSFIREVGAGKVPIVGQGKSMFSFVHTEDVASAIVAAVESDVTGILNVVDDEPTPIGEWLPVLARLVGGPAPRHVPAAWARIAIGSWGLAFMTQLRGASNKRARHLLDWEPRYPSWRDGFAIELGSTAPGSATGRGAHRC